MKKVYKDKYVGVGPLVSSQERRAAGRVGAGWGGARRGGGAERGWAGQVGSPWRQPSLMLSRASRASRTSVLTTYSEARKNEIPCKPNGETRQPVDSV